MSHPHANVKKKKTKSSKQAQSRSRSKSPRPTSKQRANQSTPTISHSYSAKNIAKPSKSNTKHKHTKKYKISTPPATSSHSLKSFKILSPSSLPPPNTTTRTPKPKKNSKRSSPRANKPNRPKNISTKPAKPKTPRVKSTHSINTNTNTNKSKPHKRRSKSPKPRTGSTPLRQPKDIHFRAKPSQTPKPKTKSKAKSNAKPRTISTPKPKHKHKQKPNQPILKQSHSSSVHSIDHSLVDQTRNLSPHRSVKNNNKKTHDGKKRSFYGESYSSKNKGKLQTLYKVKEKIGSGTFSTVRRGIRRSDKQEIAIKIITKTDLNDTEARLIKREIGVMEKLSDHENIVKLYDIFETTHHLYLIIEYCKGGELFDELINCTPKGWFSERETSQIIRQIAEGLKYMHSKNIIHRDLKLENILVSTKKNYNINKKKKKFSVGVENMDSNKKLKKNMSDRGLIREIRLSKSHNNEKMDVSDDDDDDDELNSFMNRRHSDCIAQIPHSILYGHSASHQGPESSIIIKISDFGLSKKLVKPIDNHAMDCINEEKKEEEKKRKNKIPHILSKRNKKKKKDQLNDREFAVMATNCGTLYYVAPEILNNEPYNEKVDCWSLGVICYVLLCGSLPFYSENELEISDLILKCKYDLGETDDHWLKVSDAAKDLIKNLLTLDKKNRISAARVLSHPFITGQNKLMSTKRKSVKWNAGSLFGGKWPMKFKNIIDSAKSISFHHDSSDNENNSDYDNMNHTQPPLSPNKVKYKIPFDSQHE